MVPDEEVVSVDVAVADEEVVMEVEEVAVASIHRHRHSHVSFRLVSPSITPITIVVPYIIPSITHFKEFRL